MSDCRKYSIIIHASALKQLDKLPENIRKRAASALETLSFNPRPVGVEKMSGYTDYYRIRVGNYRIVYSIEDEQLIVLVIRVGHRKDVYRKM